MWQMRIVPVGMLGLVTALSFGFTDKESAFIGSRGSYWAFQKVIQPPVPSSSNVWVLNPIDAFILEGLQAKQLKPSAQLDKASLLRRLTLDLIGLPPTSAELDAFLADHSASAYEKVVDRLLASPGYGERWGLKWLDVVRYADTNGFELDQDRPHAWRYRDYVIDSFNQDKAFDRFIEEQIAGDEMFPGDKTALIAAGYARAGSEHIVSGNIDPDVSRQEVLTEIATSVGQTFLAMTVNCARCHNHKFDPILQADFYRMQAIFAGAKGKEVDIATADEKAQWKVADEAYKARLKPVTDTLEKLSRPYQQRIEAERLAQIEPQLRDAYKIPKDNRTPEQEKLASNAADQIESTWDVIVAAMSPEDKAKRAELRVKLHEIEQTEPNPLPQAYTYLSTGEAAPQSYILRLGDPKNQLDPVEPAVPRVIQANYEIPKAAVGRRTALARWLASADNPLTARVMVNRIWQLRIGNGIIRTPNDFGLMGDRPSNRALLDWLAGEFTAQGWSVKKIDRLIVMSNAYRQISAPNPAGVAADPENRLLWRMNRKRMEGEMLRDEILSVTGSLNPKLGGRPVRIPIEPEVYDLIFTEHERDGLWPVSPDKTVQNRRSIYLYNKRSVRLPLLSAYDQPDAITSCPVRGTSTHALQALSLLNSAFMQEQSQAFANRLQLECKGVRTCEVRTAWRLGLSRPPNTTEKKLAQGFFVKGGSLIDMCLALLNRNEFVYVP